MEEFLNQLNDNQREAVLYNEGPSLVIAGAGSGKTRVLTYKIAYLILQNIRPYNILALTFTNKAAREMKERIAGVVGEGVAHRLWMGTFHSIFSKILRRESDKIGFSSDFTIYDSSDSKNLIRSIVKELKLDDKIYRIGAIQARISNAKNALFLPEQYASDKEMYEADMYAKMPRLREIYQIYWNRCRNSGVMDFDDLLLYTNILFRDFPDVLSKYQNQFQFILVDEYQDTNYAQYIIVKQLAETHHRICVVGDDAQSIYSFRGANIDNILNFRSTYPESRLFKLEQNYRSTQTIVNAANSLIKKNKEQIEKKVFSEKNPGEKIYVISAYSDYEEGYAVSAKIVDLRMSKQYAYQDFAILYRTNAQSRIFEEALRKRNIPYRIYGGLSFYQRKEIKDIIAYFRMVVNPHDEEALKRTINYPARGIGSTTLQKIIDCANTHHASLWAILSDPIAHNLQVNAGTAKKLAGYKELIETFITEYKTANAYELGLAIIKQTGLSTDLYSDKTPEGLSRVQNMEELTIGLNDFVNNRLEEGIEEVSLSDFLSEISLMTDQDSDKSGEIDRVTMMTIHAAKGLEFKNVFVVGLEEDLFPSSMNRDSEREMEEERRLFYVAITRAEENCILSYAKSRFIKGSVTSRVPSRFIKDIDKDYLQMPLDMMLSHDADIRQTTNFRGQPDKDQFEITSKAPWEDDFLSKGEKEVAQPVQNIGNLTVGNIIQHERFGIGKVSALEGSGENAKASVEFENFGKKQLLLKFAKYAIIN